MAADVALVARPSQPISAESPALSSAVAPSTPMRETGSCAPIRAQAMPSSTRYLARSRTDAGTSSSVVLATQVASRPVGPAGSVAGRPVAIAAAERLEVILGSPLEPGGRGPDRTSGRSPPARGRNASAVGTAGCTTRRTSLLRSTRRRVLSVAPIRPHGSVDRSRPDHATVRGNVQGRLAPGAMPSTSWHCLSACAATTGEDATRWLRFSSPAPWRWNPAGGQRDEVSPGTGDPYRTTGTFILIPSRSAAYSTPS